MSTPASGRAPGAVEARPEVRLLAGYHSPQVEVEVRLNTNECAEPPPQGFADALGDAVRSLSFNRYPDREATQLRSALAAYHGVRPEQVFCANGSNEVIQCVLLAFGGPGRASVVFEPTYALHAHISRVTGTPVVSGGRDERFCVDLEDAGRVVARAARTYGPESPAVTFLCSPNNPTGNAEPRATVEGLASLVPGLLLVDEAYGQFAPSSALELVDSRRQVAVVRTFSKTWAMAALRLGYLIGDREVVEACERVALPYHLDALKQVAGRLALEFDRDMRARVARIVEQRGRVTDALGALPLEVWPSDANFVLFRVPSGDATAVWQRLLEHSVLVRDVSGWPGLEGCLRVTVGTPDENDRFLDALRAALAPTDRA